MYYYRRKTNPVKWLAIIIVLVAVSVFGYWFYVNYFSKIDFWAVKNTESEKVNDILDKPVKEMTVGLIFTKASVEVNIDDKGFEQAIQDTILHQNDKIKTGSDSLAIIKMANGSVVRLGQNTEIVLEDLAENNVVIKQIQGRSYHNLKQHESYKVLTLSAEIKATGTIFEVITNVTDNSLVVSDVADSIMLNLNDKDGLLMSSRLVGWEKAIVDFKAPKNSLLKIENIKKDVLIKEEWYKWNFELDEKGDQLAIESQSQQDAEPDFSTSDTDLELIKELKDDEVYLTWLVYNHDDFKSYQLVRSETDIDLKYPNNKVIKSADNVGTTSYWDKDVVNGKKYYYRICVVKINDKVFCGNVVVAEIPAKEPDTTPPASVVLSATVSVEGVQLRWTGNKEDDFSEYRVVKSLINSALKYPGDGSIVLREKGQESFLDNQVNITSVGTVYYRVCGLDTARNVACSNVVRILDGQVK